MSKRNDVAKFGGTSLAELLQFLKVISIILANPSYLYIVVSAPGKRFDGDTKVTDHLYALASADTSESQKDAILLELERRFRAISHGLGLPKDFLDTEFQIIRERVREIRAGKNEHVPWLISRGEHLSALILAKKLGFLFLDAAKVLIFDKHGRINMEKSKKSLDTLNPKGLPSVIGGFHGSSEEDGQVVLMPRGGSDLTAAYITALTNANTCAIYSDTPMRAADPRIVPGAKIIREISFREVRELTSNGAQILHPDVTRVLKGAGKQILLLDTNHPDDAGTLVIPDGQARKRKSRRVVGVSVQRFFSIYTIVDAGMNEKTGYLLDVLSVFKRRGINFQHTPSGVDEQCVVVRTSELCGEAEAILEEIRSVCNPENITVEHDMTLVRVVGDGMAQTIGIAGRVGIALALAGINIHVIDQGASERAMTFGVRDIYAVRAVQFIYKGFFGRSILRLLLSDPTLRVLSKLVA